jgi:hypothetical protein
MTRLARGVAVGSLILLVHGTAVVWLTWPLAAQVTTHPPGPGTDDLLLAWALSQETRVLTEGWAAVERSDIFHPTPNSISTATGIRRTDARPRRRVRRRGAPRPPTRATISASSPAPGTRCSSPSRLRGRLPHPGERPCTGATRK